MMEQLRKHLWKTLISVGISVLLVIYIYINRHSIFGAFAHIDPGFLIAVFLGQVGIQISNAMVLKHNLKPIGSTLGFGEAFRLTIVSSFVNFFTPIVGGASLKAVYLKKRHEIPYPTFASAIYANYLMFFLSSFLLGIVALLAIPGALTKPAGQVVAIFFVGGIAGSLLFIFFGHRITGLVRKLSPSNKFVKKVKGMLEQADEGWSMMRGDKKSLFMMAVWSGIATLFVALVYWGAMRSLNIYPNIQTLIIYAALAIVGLLFNVTPGSIGIREAVYAAINSITGITAKQVVAFALIDRPAQLIVIGLGWVLFSRSLFNGRQKTTSVSSSDTARNQIS